MLFAKLERSKKSISARYSPRARAAPRGRPPRTDPTAPCFEAAAALLQQKRERERERGRDAQILETIFQQHIRELPKVFQKFNFQTCSQYELGYCDLEFTFLKIPGILQILNEEIRVQTDQTGFWRGQLIL